ncbi:MAG: carbohydrate kinase family protein [Chloroflexi bacterium]|nr:carbohydrate kinase family protein [Chloroflexota bacterium]
MVQGDERVQKRPFPVKVIDTVGAGDSFNAGFFIRPCPAASVSKSLQLARACGPFPPRRAGGTTAQPILAEALQLLFKSTGTFIT